jgi:hypothetical protein
LQKTMHTVFRERHRRFEVVSFQKRAPVPRLWA